jgi:hypothetical protein
MKDEDIIGKEFSVFRYDRYRSISWDHRHDKYIGDTAVVLNLHSTWPEYALAEIITQKDGKIPKHFPTHLIREQLEQKEKEEEENTSVEDLLVTMKQLISRI